MTDSQRLLADLNKAAAITGLSASYLAMKGIGNGNLPKRLKEKRIVYPSTAAKLRRYLAAEIKRRKAQ